MDETNAFPEPPEASAPEALEQRHEILARKLLAALEQRSEQLTQQLADEEAADLPARELTEFLKVLQGVEDMINRIERKRDQRTNQRADLLEMRREIEKQIEALIDESAKGGIS